MAYNKFSTRVKETLCKVVYVLRNFSLKEKALFFLFALIFITSSLSILWKINNLYLVKIPADGGTLKEGVIGTPRFINPVLAMSDADRDMVNLIYSGLLRPDNKGNLVPDLAEKFEISEDKLSYTFTLKPNLTWQDGQPLTSNDIIFTIQQIKDPDIKSPKRASWEGVEVERVDERSIIFLLKKAYAPFLENTTIGILPKHIWKNATSEQMSFSEFNINPVGSGPYKIEEINRNSSGVATSYELVPNKKFALGKPFVKNLILFFYSSEKELLKDYQNGDVDSISAIAPQVAKEIQKKDSILKTLSLPRIFGTFFNQNQAEIFSNKEIRKALNMATDKNKIIEEVLQGFGTKLDYPIPPGTFGALNPTEEKFSTTTINQAMTLLKTNGWKFEEETDCGIEEKNDCLSEKKILIKKTKNNKEGIRFEFSLSTSDVPDLKQTAELLKEMWGKIGAKVTLKIFETGDLNQNVIRPRKYDALLFGEIVGREPDPFAFWHSSQRNDPGLNIALYTNITVDNLLEEARTISNEKERKEKYEEFQKEVANDIPAVFLYSPKFIYLTPSLLKGIEKIESITVPSERFSQIYKWYIKTDKVWKFFAKTEK